MLRTETALILLVLAFGGGVLVDQMVRTSGDTEQSAGQTGEIIGSGSSSVSDVSVKKPRQQNASRPGTLGTSVSPSPAPVDPAELQARIKENQNALDDIDQQLSQASQQDQSGNQAQLADLQQRIDQQQSLIAGIEAEIQSKQNQATAAQRNEETRLSQQAGVVQSELSSLQARISEQDQQVRVLEQQYRQIIAPAGSDIYVNAQENLNVAQQRLNALRSQYAGLLSSQAANVQSNYADQRNDIQSQQAAQVDLALAEARAKDELQRLTQEYQQLSQSSKTQGTDVQKLRDERQRLMEQTRQLQQTYEQRVVR